MKIKGYFLKLSFFGLILWFFNLGLNFELFSLKIFNKAQAYSSEMKMDSSKMKMEMKNDSSEKKRIRFFGNLRFRKEVHRDPEAEKKNKIQLKYRLRLGTHVDLDSHWDIGLRFRSKASNIRSPDRTLDILSPYGEEDSKTVDFGLDQFYVRYTFFSEKDVPFNLSITEGRFQMPLWLQSGAFWDPDIQVEGLSFYVPFLRKFDAQMSYIIMRREGSSSRFFNLEDFFIVEQVRFRHKFEMSKLILALTSGYMSDGDEAIPVTLIDEKSKVFETSYFFMGSAQWKYLGWPVKLTLGTDFLKSFVDNGDDKNSIGYVGLVGGKYKKLSLKLSYFSIGDASAPFIGGGKRSSGTLDVASSSTLGEFFTQDSFRATKNGNIGFKGFKSKLQIDLSKEINFNFTIYTYKPKKTNKFKQAKMSHDKATYRYQIHMNVKF